MKQNYTKSDYSDSWFEDGFVYQVISPKVRKINMAIAIQLIEDRRRAMGDMTDVLVLVKVNNALSVESDVRKFYDTQEPYVGIRAIAMIIDNYIALTVGKMVFLLNKQPIPIQLFNSKEKATRWLLGVEGKSLPKQ